MAIIQFQYSNAERHKSKRPKQRNDCTVVSYALALDLTYDASYEYLAFAGRKSGRGFNMAGFLQTTAFNRNRFENLVDTHPEIRFLSVIELMESGILNEGKYIIIIKRHAFTVIDGVIHDMHMMYVRGKSIPQIYSVWKVTHFTEKTLKIKVQIGQIGNY